MHEIISADGTMTGIRLKHKSGDTEDIACDALLPFFGLSTALGPIAQWGLSLNKQTISIDPATAMTNIEDIYAIGDIADYDKKLKLILTGFAEAAQAAHHIYHRRYPDTPLHMEYSTTKGLPGG